MNVNQKWAFQQLILQLMRRHCLWNIPMTTRQIVEKLEVQHKDDLEKIGIDAKDYYFYEHVLRQLKNLEKQGELKSQLHRGGPYDVYLSWNFRGEQE